MVVHVIQDSGGRSEWFATVLHTEPGSQPDVLFSLSVPGNEAYSANCLVLSLMPTAAGDRPVRFLQHVRTRSTATPTTARGRSVAVGITGRLKSV